MIERALQELPHIFSLFDPAPELARLREEVVVNQSLIELKRVSLEFALNPSSLAWRCPLESGPRQR
jgi:hypothetical protein